MASQKGRQFCYFSVESQPRRSHSNEQSLHTQTQQLASLTEQLRELPREAGGSDSNNKTLLEQ